MNKVDILYNVLSLLNKSGKNLEFFNLIASKCNFEFVSNFKEGLAACSYRDRRLLILLPDQYFELSNENKAYILAHELIHIIYKHPILYAKKASDMIMQIACDLFINQQLNKLLPPSFIPEQGIQIERFIELGLLSEQDRDKTIEYYYKKLKQQSCTITLDPKGNGSNNWEEFEKLSILDKELLKDLIENTIEAGNIQGSLRDIEITKTQSSINYKRLLDKFITNSIFTKLETSVRKFNKRFPDFPGLYEKELHSLLVTVDTSGSINNTDINEIFNQIDKFVKLGCIVDILESDCGISKEVYRYTNKRPSKMSGGGGTDFNPAIRYFNKNINKYGAMLYLTDGYASTPSIKSKKPMCWILTSNGKSVEQLKNEKFQGFKIKIK